MTREFIVYNCKDVLISFGPYSLTGYADDGFLTIEDMAEEVAPTYGCDGAVTTSIDPNASSKVTLTNLYGVKANRILARLAAGLRDGELKTYPLLIKKKTGELLLYRLGGKDAKQRFWKIWRHPPVGNLHRRIGER